MRVYLECGREAGQIIAVVCFQKFEKSELAFVQLAFVSAERLRFEIDSEN